MITPPIGGLTTTPTPNADGSRRPDELGRDEFLQLLVTQLRYQDPLSPADPEEFAAQLAQFSALEQLLNVNENLEALGDSDATVASLLNDTAAMGALGRKVVAVGDQFEVDGSGAEAVTVQFADTVQSGTVRIYDQNGIEVGSVQLGPTPEGRQSIDVSSATDDLSDGVYRFEVEALDSSGARVDAQTLVDVVVDGVRYGPEGPVLLAGGIEIPLGNVLELATKD